MFEQSHLNIENKWKKLFDILPVGVSVIGPDHKIAEFNDRLGEILQITKEGIERGDYLKRSYIHGDGRPMFANEFPSSRAISEQVVVKDIEVGVVKEDGSTVWTRVSAAPLPFPEAICVIVTDDITDQKRTEAELRRSKIEAEQFNKFSIDRELRIIELKKEVEELKKKLGVNG